METTELQNIKSVQTPANGIGLQNGHQPSTVTQQPGAFFATGSIIRLQEVLMLGPHSGSTAGPDQMALLINKRLWFHYLMTPFSILLYLTDVITDIYMAIIYTTEALKLADIELISRLFRYYLFYCTVYTCVSVIIPSILANISNKTSVWQSKKYQKWNIGQKILWIIMFPFYILLNLELVFLYYTNFQRIKKLIMLRKRDDSSDEINDLTAECSGRIMNIIKFRWLEIILEAIPQFLLQVNTLMNFSTGVFHVTAFSNNGIIFCIVASIVSYLVSFIQGIRAHFIMRQIKLNFLFVFAYSFCVTSIIVLRVLLITTFISAQVGNWFESLIIFFVPRANIVYSTWIITISLFLVHFGFEVTWWRLRGVKGMKGIGHCIYAAFHHFFVPAASSFLHCVITNLLMIIDVVLLLWLTVWVTVDLNREFLFGEYIYLDWIHYITGSFTSGEYVVPIYKAMLVYLIILHIVNILLYQYYDRKKQTRVDCHEDLSEEVNNGDKRVTA